MGAHKPLSFTPHHNYNLGSHGGGLLFVEFKDEITGINSHPQTELPGRVALLGAKGMDEDEAFRKLFERSRIPSLGLTIVGCDITFYAMVPLDTHYRLVRLTPTFSCIGSASGGRDRLFLYAAFIAAAVLQARIQEDVEKIKATLSPMPIAAYARLLPAVSRLRKYPPPSDHHMTFEIQDHFYNKRPYLAKMPGSDKPIFIKFVRRYSIIGVSDANQLRKHGKRWIGELRHLVESFHDKGMVHGDLRDANIVCEGEQVVLADLDWAGKGEVLYHAGAQ